LILRQKPGESRKAISGIVAGLILFVLLFTVGTGYFLWIYANNASYSQAQANRNQAELNQQSENVLLSASVTSNILSFTALNQGGHAVNLTEYYVNIGNSVVCYNLIRPGSSNCYPPSPSLPPLGVVMNPGSSPYSQSTGYNCGGCTVSNPATIEVLTATGRVFTTAYPPPSAALCGGGTITPSLSTTLSSSSVKAGTSVTDTASLTGGCNPTGNIIFTAYSSATCSGASLVYTSGSVVVIGNGAYISVSPYVPNSVGTYYWEASYSGDTYNLATATTCGTAGETLTVTKAVPSITTTLSASSIPSGQSVADSATLSMSSGNNAGGTVTYSYFADGTCSGSPMLTPTMANGLIVTVSNGNVPNSPATTFISVGPYSWNATYSGDANNKPAASSCEPLSVISPTTSTQLPLAVEINSFRFIYAQGYAIGDGYAPGVGGYYGYVVPTSTTMVFAVTLVNVDPFGRSITLNSYSFLYVAVLSNGGGQCYPFPLYILGGVSDVSPYTAGVTTSAYTSPVVLAYQGTATIFFGPSSPGGTGGSSLACKAGGQTPSPLEAAVAPFLTGQFSDGTPLSLTLPFTSIYASPASISSCSPSSGGNQCWAHLGDTVHLVFAANSFSATPSMYYVSSFGATPTPLTCSGGTCSATDFYFAVPGGLTSGSYYMIFATDGTNYAYATLHVVTKSSTTTAVTCAPSSPKAETSTTCTATVTGTAPTGTVAWSQTGGGTGATFTPTSCTLSGTSCSVSYTQSTVSTVTITATYGGDSNNVGSSGTAMATFVAATTTTTVNCIPSSLQIGSSTTCTATVTGAGPSGTITFSSTGGGTFSPSTTCTLAAGSCSVSYTQSTVGSATITSTYGGDSNNAGSSGGTIVTFTKHSSTTTITCTPISVSHTSSSSCTITVTGFNPTGTVTFTLTASNGATATATPATCTLVSGQCSVTLTSSKASTVTITANYGGDANNLASSSSAFTVTFT
jgi:Bacterial Ig-like domain (group 3)